MDEIIGFGIYQSCRNKGSVGHVSVFCLRWCCGGVGVAWDRVWKGGMVLCLCV